MKKLPLLSSFFAVICLVFNVSSAVTHNALIFQTDFGLNDGAVAAMKGVAFSVSPQQPMFDLTHEIPAYNIWDAAYRLYQTASYWPSGTVFVSVVDPGVGTNRPSVVLKTKSGHYFVSPDNGSLALVAEQLGIEAVRKIDEETNRLSGSAQSYTFHGRDVYAYTGARLASQAITFEQVGPLLTPAVKMIPYQKAILDQQVLKGNIPVLDVQYGNVWSNIPVDLLIQAGIQRGDMLCVRIYHRDVLKYETQAPYVNSFGDVPEKQPLIYLNSLLHVSIALNIANLAKKHEITAGSDWSIHLKKCMPTP